MKKIKYKYPYYQAIGYYMQKTGVYNREQIQLLKQFDFIYDFYLTHEMENPDYSDEWRLHVPKGF